MYNDDIKKLLEKHFGKPQNTLTIDSGLKRDGCIYYFSLPDNDKVLQIRDILNQGLGRNNDAVATELRQIYQNNSDAKKESAPQCACYTEYEGKWRVRIYRINGVRYHRSLGRRIAASIILSKEPVVSLYDSDFETSFFGFWSHYVFRENAKRQLTEGMSYWINKNLLYNQCFRGFAAELLSLVGEQSKNYIFKDIGRTIKKYGVFLPTVAFERIIKLHTPKEFALLTIPDAKRINVNLNTIDLNKAHVLSKIVPFIRESDWKYLRTFPSEIVSNIVTLNALFEGIKTEDIVAEYYKCMVEDEGEWYSQSVKDYARDYGRMCLELNIPISLRHSYKGLIQAHNELSKLINRKANEKEFDIPLVAIPSRFDVLEKNLELLYPAEFERIRDARRLLREGEEQHNCVFSRKGIVRRDRAAIFHWDYAGDGKNYTVQFAADGQGEFFVEEIRAKYNEACTPIARAELREILSRVQDYCAYEKYAEMDMLELG